MVVGGGGIVTYAVAGPSEEPGPPELQPKRPVKVYDLALQGTGSSKRALPRRGTEQFSLVGVSWTGAAKHIDGTAQVRTRGIESGEWSAWQDLEVDEDPPEDVEPGMRGASAPLWVGPSDGVEVQVVRADGTSSAGLPKGLEVNLVDPGVVTKAERRYGATAIEPAAYAAETAPATTEPAASSGAPSTGATGPEATASVSPSGSPSPSDSVPASPTGSVPPTDTASPSPTATKPTAPPSTVTRPPIVSRAQWGADESKVEDPPTYIDKVQAVFVHHTVGSNGYSCAESASLVRGIMAYHVEVNGWNDLGYNFLVDKCGQIFEGRGGGADLPVTGAHTYGFNSYSTGIAVLGDYQGDAAKGVPAGKPTRAALESVARVAAWKLGQYGGDPKGTVTLTAAGSTGVWDNGEQATLNTISGHRDGYATACPGTNLYSKLGEIRRFAASAGRNAAIPTADHNRDGVTDLVAGVPKANAVRVVPGSVNGPVTSAAVALTQSSPGVPGSSESGDGFGSSSAWGDVNGDGYADLAVGAPGEDDTSGHADRGAVTVLYGPALNTGFSYTTSGVTQTGAKLGTTVAVGDFDSDGKADVFSAGTGRGGNWNARTTGGATKYGTLTSSTGAVSYLDAATGDFNRDGYADVAVNYRDTGGIGRVVRFAGSASGLTKAGVISVRGGRSIAAGDFNGNGYDDIVIGQPVAAESGGSTPGGQITMVPGTSSGFTTTGMRTIHQNTASVPGGNESGDALGTSVSAGDVNADGYADVLAGAPGEDLSRSGANRSDAGDALLFRGSSSGLTGSGSVAVSQDTSGVPGSTESGDRFGSAVSLTDLSGYGRADLTVGAEGEDTSDGVLLYVPGNSSGLGFGDSSVFGRGTLGIPADARLGQTLTP
ncbi:FG-GAP-like repeat-containing protein [Streptomyces sp. NPDC052013]|uniref:FG-GAP-like repeat-containing protein n=1 Tax=Streptomyces sp. NPDC052013 TaxID=3365679 RepID=UPI0037D4742D